MKIQLEPLVRCPGHRCNGEALIEPRRKLCNSCLPDGERAWKAQNAASGQIAKARRGTRSSTAGLSGLLQNPAVESTPQTKGTTNE